MAQFQISPAPPPHHLCSSTPPRGPLGRLCLHRCGSLRVYTAQHLSDALKAHPVPHPSAYLGRVLTVLSWLCGLVHTFCNLVMGERKSCYNPEATWLLALSPFLLQIFFLFKFLVFWLLGQYSAPKTAGRELQADAAGRGGRGPRRREGVAWAGEADSPAQTSLR